MLLIIGITNLAWSEDLGKVTKIEIPEKEVTTYTDGKGWVTGTKIPVEKIPVPLTIISKTGMRYKVAVDGQEVWLDRNDVVADVPVMMPADCEPRRLTSSSSATTRGLGEPCKSEPPKSSLVTAPATTPPPKSVPTKKSSKGKKK